jgi:hypothetical protein
MTAMRTSRIREKVQITQTKTIDRLQRMPRNEADPDRQNDFAVIARMLLHADRDDRSAQAQPVTELWPSNSTAVRLMPRTVEDWVVAPAL